MTTYLIGEAPTAANGPPFTGKSGRFLSEVVGFDVHDYFTCLNIFQEYPGPHPSGHGAAFPLLQARELAKQMVVEFKPGDRVILVGRRTAKAFRVRETLSSFQWGDFYSHTYLTLSAKAYKTRLCVIPHPSGVNRWWNDEKHREHVRRFLVKERDRVKGMSKN